MGPPWRIDLRTHSTTELCLATYYHSLCHWTESVWSECSTYWCSSPLPRLEWAWSLTSDRLADRGTRTGSCCRCRDTPRTGRTRTCAGSGRSTTAGERPCRAPPLWAGHTQAALQQREIAVSKHTATYYKQQQQTTTDKQTIQHKHNAPKKLNKKKQQKNSTPYKKNKIKKNSNSTS